MKDYLFTIQYITDLPPPEVAAFGGLRPRDLVAHICCLHQLPASLARISWQERSLGIKKTCFGMDIEHFSERASHCNQSWRSPGAVLNILILAGGRMVQDVISRAKRTPIHENTAQTFATMFTIRFCPFLPLWDRGPHTRMGAWYL